MGDATESTGVWTQKSIPSLVLMIMSASSRLKGLEAVYVGISAAVTDISISESLMSEVDGGEAEHVPRYTPAPVVESAVLPNAERYSRHPNKPGLPPTVHCALTTSLLLSRRGEGVLVFDGIPTEFSCFAGSSNSDIV